MCYHTGVEQTKYESRAFSTQSKAHAHHPTGLWKQWNISPVPISYQKCTTDGRRRTDVSLILTEKSQIMHQWQQAHLFRSDLCSFLTCNPNSINSISLHMSSVGSTPRTTCLCRWCTHRERAVKGKAAMLFYFTKFSTKQISHHCFKKRLMYILTCLHYIVKIIQKYGLNAI